MMQFVTGIGTYVLPFLVILTVLVFVHELGHFLVARRYGVRVEVFSVGFGPELFGWTDRKGTRWRLSLLPLGGYVRMMGDGDVASVTHEPVAAAERQHSLFAKPVGQRAAVSVAGPLANFLFAIVALAILLPPPDVRSPRRPPTRSSRTELPRPPGSRRATASSPSMAARSRASRSFSASSRTAPADRSLSRSGVARRSWR